MALVSITRDTGDFGKTLRHARELVALDSADTRLCSVVSDRSRKAHAPLAGTRIAAPVDELNCEREVRNWHRAAPSGGTLQGQVLRVDPTERGIVAGAAD